MEDPYTVNRAWGTDNYDSSISGNRGATGGTHRVGTRLSPWLRRVHGFGCRAKEWGTQDLPS